MNQSTWGQAKSLLANAAELPAADRQRFVTDHCLDPELRREVLDLLASPAALSAIVNAHGLQTGARLGPYVIDRLLGSGGMGEVYNAHDTTLNRSVAIKVLLNPLVDDPDQSARFRREAQVLAALNHPNIAQIYGFEEFSGVAALVMELVDGPTLGERIAHRAIPLAQTLPIAIQIADALDAAHTQGIVHRDLKPANVKVREDGTVKVLDFGLGKALDLTASSSAGALGSPTQSVGATQPGFVLGTAAYMAPEQACGKPADKRADIWSFGCVLYEMLTGKRAFAGNDIADTLSLVIGHDPDWTALPPDTPPPILKVLHRCLEKNRDRRLADIADARFEIEDALSPSIHSRVVITRDRVAPTPGWWRVLPWVIVAACGGALALVLVSAAPWRKTPVAAPLRLSADLGAGTAVMDFGRGASLALSPDGSEIAFLGLQSSERVPRLYVRHLEQLEATVLPETDGADGPFFSPDGQWIAFFASGKLKKISVTGGAALTLCDAPNGRGGTWTEDGIIAFSPNQQTSLWRVSSSGGAAQPLTTLDAGELTQRWPQVLPGGKAVLYSSLTPVGDFDFDKGNLVVQPLPTGVRKVVQRGGYYGRYVPSGHLVYLHNGTLFAAAFDPVRLELTGPPRPVVDSVRANTTGGAGLFAVSSSGALVYVVGSGGDRSPIGWLDRSGKSAILRSAPSDWAGLSFAPDGRRIALEIWDGKQRDIWTGDWARDSLERLTTSNSHSRTPVWTPDGRRIVYTSQRGEMAVAHTFNLYSQRADGTGDAQRLTTSENLQVPGSWHPNGKVLAFEEQAAYVNLMLLPMDGDEASGWRPGTPTVFASGAFDQRAPMFSPDGRWLAYESNQSGQVNVYVRPFPGPGVPTPISNGGGLFPTWSRTRHELLYSTFDQRIMVVDYSVERDSFHAEPPRSWPEGRYQSKGISGPVRLRTFDLHPDGNRIGLAPLGAATPSLDKLDRLTIVLNFFDELRRIAPAAER